MCDALFISAIKHGLKIRGAITAGDLIISGRAVIGKPIIEAHKQESLQDWMGCLLTKECINLISKEELDEYIRNWTIIKYKIPLKSGKVFKQHAFNWIKSLEWSLKFKNHGKPVTKEQLYEATSLLDKDPNRWEDRRKVYNTRQFRDYAISMIMRK